MSDIPNLYRLADGTQAEPGDCSKDDHGVLRHKNGMAVVLDEKGEPMTSAREDEKNKTAEAAEAGKADEPEKPAEPVNEAPAAKPVEPAAPADNDRETKAADEAKPYQTR